MRVVLLTTHAIQKQYSRMHSVSRMQSLDAAAQIGLNTWLRNDPDWLTQMQAARSLLQVEVHGLFNYHRARLPSP